MRTTAEAVPPCLSSRKTIMNRIALATALFFACLSPAHAFFTLGSIGPFVSNRGAGVEGNFAFLVNVGAAGYKLHGSSRPAWRLNVGLGIPDLQAGVIVVNEPLDSSESVGRGIGIRVYRARMLDGDLGVAAYGTVIDGTERNRGEVGIQLVYLLRQ
jgi:hypothetical protein